MIPPFTASQIPWNEHPRNASTKSSTTFSAWKLATRDPLYPWWKKTFGSDLSLSENGIYPWYTPVQSNWWPFFFTKILINQQDLELLYFQTKIHAENYDESWYVLGTTGTKYWQPRWNQLESLESMSSLLSLWLLRSWYTWIWNHSLLYHMISYGQFRQERSKPTHTFQTVP